jgi:endonuclease-3
MNKTSDAEADIESLKGKAKEVYKILKKNHPKASCTLNFKNPLEIMVASMLSAQCTDGKVNEVTKGLFKKYKRAKDYAEADLAELEEDVRSTGFYRNKARALKESCRGLVENYKGKVPNNMEELVGLPGIGRKTANLVLLCAFNKPAIVVDTHVYRTSRRLGLTEEKKADKIEFDLREILSKDRWSKFSMLLVSHGRETCKAKKPLCSECSINHLCDYYAESSPAA